MMSAIRLRARRVLARYLPASIKRAIRRIVPYRPRRLPPRAVPAIRRFDLRLPIAPSGDSTSLAATVIAADSVLRDRDGHAVRI